MTTWMNLQYIVLNVSYRKTNITHDLTLTQNLKNWVSWKQRVKQWLQEVGGILGRDRKRSVTILMLFIVR